MSETEKPTPLGEERYQAVTPIKRDGNTCPAGGRITLPIGEACILIQEGVIKCIPPHNPRIFHDKNHVSQKGSPVVKVTATATHDITYLGENYFAGESLVVHGSDVAGLLRGGSIKDLYWVES
ncbi:MAG: hypothetical protein HQL52_03890 [Magnetococcales bacterium]|nr:hypothetical protein [Magnetococcales bacterium]